MVAEILNLGVGRKGDCLNLPSGSGSSSRSSSEWLLTYWYTKLQLLYISLFSPSKPVAGITQAVLSNITHLKIFLPL